MPHGLFIGIDDYKFAPLQHCVDDAVAMRDLLVSLGVLSSGETTLMALPACEKSIVPTREEILRLLLKFYDSAKPLDRLIVFYAGHGLSFRQGRSEYILNTAIVPANVEQLKNSGGKLIDMDDLIGRFRRRGAQEQYWIIDACRNKLDPPPSVLGTGWDPPAVGNDHEMAQSVLYAVAPLGEARRKPTAKHGMLTGHLLDALACKGAAEWGGSGWYDEASDGWLIDLESLANYAGRQIRTSVSELEAEYQLPTCWIGEKKPGPLLKVEIKDRPFAISVNPPEAAAAVSASLQAKRKIFASWPPRPNGDAVALLPDRYALKVRLTDQLSKWVLPKIPDPALVDIRDTDRFVIAMQSREMVNEPPVQPSSMGAQQSPDLSVAPAVGQPSLVVEASAAKGLDFFGPVHLEPPTVIVKAIDPGVIVHFTRLSGGKEERDELPNIPVTLSEGLWRIEIRIGCDVIGVHENNFAAGERYTIAATAQVTPALAALLPDPAQEASLAARQPHSVLMPSETIGPMQGAILSTLLPLLALKPLDEGDRVLCRFAHQLGIPVIGRQTQIPLAVALAFDGSWRDADVRQFASSASIDADAKANLIWQDDFARVSLFMIDDEERSNLVAVSIPNWGIVSAAAPRIPNYCTTVSLTLWPDGHHDISINLFSLPPGSDRVQAGRLARALAIAARLYRAGRDIDDVDYDVFPKIPWDCYGNPVLDAIVWFARDRRLNTDRELLLNGRKELQWRQDELSEFLSIRAPQLGDARVIAALSASEKARELDDLLDDPAMPAPVLASSLSALARHAIASERLDHWSVARIQNVAPDAVFNVAVSRDRTSKPGE